VATISFDSNTAQAIDAYIKKHFPEATSNDATRTGVALALWAEKSGNLPLGAYDAQLAGLAAQVGIKPGANAVAKAMPKDSYRYYDIEATHAREIPNYPPFIGHLSMVRVTLPVSNANVTDFHTGIGTVGVSDHLYRSVEEFKKTYGGAPYNQTTRLDLVTPARELGVRFGAISAYLGYTNGAATPSFYVLEAGTATGDPKVPYACPTIDGGIVAYADYQPTPFAHRSHIYRGSLRVVGDSPDLLSVWAEAKPHTSYLKLSAQFTETTTPQNIWPGFLIVRAIAIVAERLPYVPIEKV
jgi:hypothetical protein